ncbi:MAG TPA: secondary thiamine-phosphate synthase enzyme YjbQ [Candidatus Polarisedimenticolia bacterium]|jgi:secondary thiamine-phosphate synthase enzyme|nr:secondary thiamine-phosphate synthase enzyme YjbQ [Candidatus Polarisedimenticolia bacterium]
MAVKRAEIKVGSERRVQVLNVTLKVAEACAKLRVREGILLVSCRHTTCALLVNEDEEGLRRDLERLGESLLDPFRGRDGYRHDAIDDNAQAHLTSVLLGHSLTLPVDSGKPVLGTWQSLLMLEMDGPRSRTLDLTLLGD